MNQHLNLIAFSSFDNGPPIFLTPNVPRIRNIIHLMIMCGNDEWIISSVFAITLHLNNVVLRAHTLSSNSWYWVKPNTTKQYHLICSRISIIQLNDFMQYPKIIMLISTITNCTSSLYPTINYFLTNTTFFSSELVTIDKILLLLFTCWLGHHAICCNNSLLIKPIKGLVT